MSAVGRLSSELWLNAPLERSPLKSRRPPPPPRGLAQRGKSRKAPSVVLAAAFLFAATQEALAHASDRGYVLLLPTGHYIVGGAIAVAVSFLALVLLPSGSLGRYTAMRLPLFSPSDRARPFVSFLSFLVVLALFTAGFAGSRDPLSNPLPLTIWAPLWVGLTLVQGILGNVWAWIDPWYGPDRLSRRLGLPVLVRLPDKLGCWPAFIQFAGFAWFELIDPAPDDPARLAAVGGIYLAVNLAATLIFGHREWSRRGEFLSVFFAMISAFAIFQRRRHDRRDSDNVSLALPGAKLADASPLPPSGVAFLLLALSSVSFDGLSRTFFWLGLNGVNPLEFPGRTAMMTINSVGLAAAFVALAAIFYVAVLIGERLTPARRPIAEAAGLYVWSIVPIALAYHFAHYLTVLLVNGQYAVVALSDPYARGWNLFGTAYMTVSAGIASGSGAAWVLWNAQAAVIVAGHVLAVLVAHGLAGRLHPDGRNAALSQLPLTVLMVAYTVLGLWLLSTPTAG